MNSLHQPIHVLGVGGSAPAASEPRSIPEMVLEAVERALADGGLDYGDIDAAVTASVDLFDGLTASNIAVTEVVGAVMKPETRIAADGLGAVVHGACQLSAGAYGKVLVAAHCKPSMADYQGLTQWAFDPIHLQPLGVDFLTCAALQAQVLAAQDSGSETRWAAIAAERRRAAGEGGLRGACSVREVLDSPYVAAPIRAEMCAPLADGAFAAVLGNAAHSTRHPPVALTAFGYDMDAHALGDRNLAAWDGLTRACRRAYAAAGIEHPEGAFALAEPSCWFPHEEQLFLAAAGLPADTAISPQGGLFGGAVPVAAGLSRLIAAVEGMRAHPECSRAIVHGTWGAAGQAHAVAILEPSP